MYYTILLYPLAWIYEMYCMYISTYGLLSDHGLANRFAIDGHASLHKVRIALVLLCGWQSGQQRLAVVTLYPLCNLFKPLKQSNYSCENLDHSNFILVFSRETEIYLEGSL
jgi:hypothetical protein